MEVGTQTLSTNVYENDRNGLLSEVQYGNGGKVKYTYDDFDRLTGVRHDAETADRYTYEYGANGQAARVHDNNLNRTYETEYDLSDRPCRGTLRDTDGTAIYRTTLEYTRHSNLNRFREELSDGWTKDTYETSYAYDIDNRVTEMQFDDSAHKVAYTYDELGRINARTLTNGTASYLTTYTFVTGGYGTNSTTPLVSGITQGSGENAMNFAYAYDSRGNITSETRNGKVITYTYDALGQLIRVNDPNDPTAGSAGTTWVYNYDCGGNITSKSCHAYTTGTPGAAIDTITYSYTDSNWKDKLTAYDGQAITYDAIGNPLSDGTWTYTWEKGRQLKQMSKSDVTVEFKYDHNGLLMQKKVESGGTVETTEYTVHGKKVTHLTNGSNEMHFFYDVLCQPAMVSFNGAIYCYIRNLQGDIVGIVDSSGNLVVEYKYDAWGKPTLVRTLTTAYEALAKLNPFRYRGYLFDTTTGLYLLKERMYNSEMGRFINEDRLIANVPLGKNAFSYCQNNPQNGIDSNGDLGFSLLSIAVDAIGSFVGSVVNDLLYNDDHNVNWNDVVVDTITGVATGIAKPKWKTIIIAGVEVVNYTIDYFKGEVEEFDFVELGCNVGIALAGDAVGSGIGKLAKNTKDELLTTAVDAGLEVLTETTKKIVHAERQSTKGNGNSATAASKSTSQTNFRTEYRLIVERDEETGLLKEVVQAVWLNVM